jgi:hypothetical protein
MQHAAASFSLNVMGASYLSLIQEIADGDFPLPERQSVATPSSAFTRGDYVPDVLRSYVQHLRKNYRAGKQATTN